MSVFAGSTFYAVVAVALLWLAVLWLCARFKIKRRSRAVKTLFGAVTVLTVFVPINGVPLWNRVFSFYPNPSLPMLGMACAALWQRLFGIVVFKPADWRATWIFGAIAGSVLYLHPMLFGAIDFYYWGWERNYATWTLAGLSIVFLVRGNRLGVLCLAALIAYAMGALESRNGWDYLMDPFYWLLSLSMLGARAFNVAYRRFERRRQRALVEVIPIRVSVEARSDPLDPDISVAPRPAAARVQFVRK
ncbi:MAG: hypothetical protein ABIO94_09245, partial [Opitutaceae bacterium]